MIRIRTFREATDAYLAHPWALGADALIVVALLVWLLV